MGTFDSQILHWPTLADFTAYLPSVPRPAWCHGLTNHNTYIPNPSQWRGLASMNNMRAVYISKGWSAGPHLYLAAECPNPADRGIWQLTPLAHVGVHAGPCNPSKTGVENVADWEASPPTAAQYELLLDVNAAICRAWNIDAAQVNVHRECMPGRTCPGQHFDADRMRADLAARLTPQPPPARYVRVLGATVYQDSLLITPVTHLPADAVVRTNAQAPLPGYAQGVVHVVWETGSGFMRGDSVESVS